MSDLNLFLMWVFVSMWLAYILLVIANLPLSTLSRRKTNENQPILT